MEHSVHRDTRNLPLVVCISSRMTLCNYAAEIYLEQNSRETFFTPVARFTVYRMTDDKSSVTKAPVSQSFPQRQVCLFSFCQRFRRFRHSSSRRATEKEDIGTCRGFEMNILSVPAALDTEFPQPAPPPPPSFTVVTAIRSFASWPLKFQP